MMDDEVELWIDGLKQHAFSIERLARINRFNKGASFDALMTRELSQLIAATKVVAKLLGLELPGERL